MILHTEGWGFVLRSLWSVLLGEQQMWQQRCAPPFPSTTHLVSVFSTHCFNDGDFLNCAEFAPPDHEAKVFLQVKVEPALHDLVVLNKIFFFKELTSLMGLALPFFLSIFLTNTPTYIYSVS